MQPLNAYPRPQMRRSSYLCLNGTWDFAVTKADRPPERFPFSVSVPYPPESNASGYGKRIEADDTMFYRRYFTLPEGFVKERVLLHFGAVDQECEVYLNGTLLGAHKGGYFPFSFDITKQLLAQNELLVKAVDRLDHAYPWGKQKQRNGGMWYTPFSGIWQTVWLESVPDVYLTGLRITPSLTSVRIELLDNVENNAETHLAIETPSGPLCWTFFGTAADVPIPNPVLWTPEKPYLYRMKITRGEDTVESYFALRTLGIETVKGIPRLLLNGEPYFFHGLLDQGYWRDGICLPPDNDGYERDILFAKSLGFNTLRKHIRVEPLPFYEACDRLGMIVFQDLVNNGPYRFFRDTALPTLGIKRKNDLRFHHDDRTVSLFQSSLMQTVKHLYNSPCIAYWTIFNEGWGQYNADGMYALLRSLDDTRIIDATSGWFWQKQSDVDSFHVYFRPFREAAKTRPLVLSEFGGYAHASGKKQYGYRFYPTQEAYRGAVVKLYEQQIVPAVSKGLCAAIYTQISDVEQEQNGLIDDTHTVPKVLPMDLLPIAEKLRL